MSERPFGSKSEPPREKESGYLHQVDNDRRTLGTTHADTSQSIFEDLFKAEELEDRQVDRRMETETTLVRTKGRVELDTIATVYLRLSLVIFPDNAELDDALWNL